MKCPCMNVGIFDGSEFGEVNIKGEIKRQKVCNMEIWCECFGKAKADLKRIDANAISAIMAKIEGWQKMSKRAVSEFTERQQVMKGQRYRLLHLFCVPM